MGLWNWIQTKMYGVDIAQTQADMNRAETQLDYENRQDLANGNFTQSTYDQAQRQNLASHIDAQAQVNDAFQQGLDEGAAGIRNSIGGALEAPFKLAGKIIPWQVYVIAAVVLFLYLGGWQMIQGSLKGRLSDRRF